MSKYSQIYLLLATISILSLGGCGPRKEAEPRTQDITEMAAMAAMLESQESCPYAEVLNPNETLTLQSPRQPDVFYGLTLTYFDKNSQTASFEQTFQSLTDQKSQTITDHPLPTTVPLAASGESPLDFLVDFSICDDNLGFRQKLFS